MSLENIDAISKEIFDDSFVLAEQVENPEIRHIYLKHNITGEQIKKLEEKFKILFVSQTYDEDNDRLKQKTCQVVLVTNKEFETVDTNLTKKETWRLCDLAIRRMVDYGIDNYSIEDQELLKKIQDLKKKSYEN